MINCFSICLNFAFSFNLRQCSEVATLEGHGGIAHSCAWCPNGTQMACASTDHTVRVWDVALGREARGVIENMHSTY
jgi:WD40 repeat protein